LQIQIFVNALAIDNIADVYVNGTLATWMPEADEYRYGLGWQSHRVL
jgi:hypothetical protein